MTELISYAVVVPTVGRASLLTLAFGVFFWDYDLDGHLDIFSANGHIEEEIGRVQPLIVDVELDVPTVETEKREVTVPTVDVDPPNDGGVALRGIDFEVRAGEVLGTVDGDMASFLASAVACSRPLMRSKSAKPSRCSARPSSAAVRTRSSSPR